MLNTNLTPNKFSNATEDRYNRLIFKALIKYNRPLTRRFLSEATNIEIATLCKALFVLVHNRKLIKVAFIKPCVKTGKIVYHYYFTDNVGGQTL